MYSKGPSIQFYKILLDDNVRVHFEEYAVFAIIEWDVLVAHESSFAQLYKMAFAGGDPYWVKGSVLGTSAGDYKIMTNDLCFGYA